MESPAKKKGKQTDDTVYGKPEQSAEKIPPMAEKPTPIIGEKLFPEKPTYRVSEVAYYFDVSERTVYLWIENKHLDAFQIPSGQWRISKESIEKCKFAQKLSSNE